MTIHEATITLVTGEKHSFDMTKTKMIIEKGNQITFEYKDPCSTNANDLIQDSFPNSAFAHIRRKGTKT